MRVFATFCGQQKGGHYLLKNLSGDYCRNHGWINGRRDKIEGIPPGAVISFQASIFHAPTGPKLTDIHDIQVIG